MSELLSKLAAYGAYHQDRRNVATHVIGVPMIVLAVQILTSRPEVAAGDFIVTPAMALSVLAALYYLKLDAALGAAMAALLALGCGAGLLIAAAPTTVWLAVGLSVFVVGWAIQFIGHRFEGRKPAFLDDLISLLIGPMFVLAEVCFVLGLKQDLSAALPRREIRRPDAA